MLSCSDNGGPTAPTNDVHGADSLVQLGNAALERLLFQELNSPDPTRPSDVDFSEPYAFYEHAIGLDPGNRTANFGSAITGLLVLSADVEVNAAFDEWKAYLDTHTPFEVPAGHNKPLGVPLGLPAGSGAMRLPFDVVPASMLAIVRTPILAADPQIGRAQVILRDRALPKLATALARLQVVAVDPAYQFIVTPRMQGDEGASPVEIDQTDVLATRAACGLLTAATRVAVSYNLGFAAYDSTNLVNALTQGSGWLALAPGGAAQMAGARTAMLDAIDDVDHAITSLKGEIDNQDDDVIVIGPNDLARADVDSIQQNLPNARRGLTTATTRVDDWDANSNTPDEPLTINLGNLFTNPPADWKALLPPYTVSTEQRSNGAGTCDYVTGSTIVTVVVPPGTAGQYDSQLYRYVSNGGSYDNFGGSILLFPALTSVLDTAIGGLALGNCLQYLNGVSQFSGALPAGSQSISVDWRVSYCTGRCVYIPVMTFDATTFEQWVLPDPTFGGILPGQTSSEMLRTFGVTAQNWERRWVLNWSGN